LKAGCGQERVLVVGVGGLGCPAALALAQAGVRWLTLVDPDFVEVTNLHRQPLYDSSDIGRSKVERAADRLRGAFPQLKVEALAVRFGSQTAEQLFKNHSAVIDGTDDPAAKFLLSDSAVRFGVPVAYGGVLRMRGQAMLIGPTGPCLRCLFESPPDEDGSQICAQAGVLGTVAGVIGSVQASLVLGALSGQADYGKLIIFDGVSLKSRTVRVARAIDCAACGGQLSAGQRGRATDASLDITREVCPMTYVRTKLMLESLADGALLEVFLRGEEPLKGVPRSAREEGHEVLSMEPREEGRWRLLLRKNRRI
jgi:molybdopterin/thiamine biosynthesis adenylyltransferase/TusA-related sulfurtransferase